MVDYPELPQVTVDMKLVRAQLRSAGVPDKIISGIQTRALRTGRKITGEHATNRDSRWKVPETHPQFAPELHCKIIFVKLCAQIFCFGGAPEIPEELREHLKEHYLGHDVRPGTFKDSLLLEHFDFHALVAEGTSPLHGHSAFHIGHEDPTLTPRHHPDNIGWRTFRSNLIQGNMTLREARIYFVKLIGRYFELGEIDIV